MTFPFTFDHDFELRQQPLQDRYGHQEPLGVWYHPTGVPTPCAGRWQTTVQLVLLVWYHRVGRVLREQACFEGEEYQGANLPLYPPEDPVVDRVADHPQYFATALAVVDQELSYPRQDQDLEESDE